MNKIPMSPKARMLSAKENIDVSDITPTGYDGKTVYIRSDDVKRAKLTPLAKKIAIDNNISVDNLKTEGKLTKNDILRIAEEMKNSGSYRLSPAREAILKNLSQSVSETIPYTLFAKVDITKAFACYEDQKNKHDVKITLTDIFLLSAAKAIKDNPIINTIRKDGYYIQNDDVNICLAIAHKGNILTPVMKNADKMSISDIAKKRTEFIEKISSSKLTADDLSGGTFTVSNLGQGPVGHFTPVINNPQSAVLGIGRTDDEVYPDDGKFAVRKVLHLSLTADHTIIDGKAAAEFLKDIEKYLSSEV